MARVELKGGAYVSNSIIAGAQRCVNLYPETNPPEAQAPTEITHYQFPGLTLLKTAPVIERVRTLYRASNGDGYAVVGPVVYYIDPTWTFNFIGMIPDLPTPASMADNGLVIVLVDGTTTGYAIDITSRAFGVINDPDFAPNGKGALKVDYIDTFFVFNEVGTNQYYISLSEVNFALLTTGGPAFDPLDTAAKVGSADPIQSLQVVERQLWLIGALTTEPWVDTGAADFPLAELPGAFIEHGCIAPYSVAANGESIFWLGQDRKGKGKAYRSVGAAAIEISTRAMEVEFQSYADITDVVAFILQIQGHIFYILIFPSADRSWCYDVEEQRWFQLVSKDTNGTEHRSRINSCAFINNAVVVGDWQNGNLYLLDPHNFTENGNTVTWVRTFPHMISNGNRVTYRTFDLDIEVGNVPAGIPTPQVSIRWSDDRGKTFSNPILLDAGATGAYDTWISANNLGEARDRIFEVSYSFPVKAALNGAFVDAIEHKT